MTTFARWRASKLRPPTAGPLDELFAEVLGAQQDDELALLRVALLSRFVARCPDDALDAVGQVYATERFAGEPNGALDPPSGYRGRLSKAWPVAKIKGSPEALVVSLTAYGVTDVRVLREESGDYWPGFWYSRFRVQLGPDLGVLTLTSFIIGEGIIGTTPIGGPHVAAAQRRAMKRQALRLKAAHGYATDILIRVEGDLIGQDFIIGESTIGGTTEQIWIGRLIGQNITIGVTPIGGYDMT